MSTPSTPPSLTSSTCPNCGAPIDQSKIAPNQRQINCEHCGSLLNLPAQERVRELREMHAQQVVITLQTPAVNISEETVKTAGKVAGGVGCGAVLSTLIVLAIVGGTLIFVLQQVGVLSQNIPIPGINATGMPKLSSLIAGDRVIGQPVPLSSVDDGGQKLAYITLVDSDHAVVLFDARMREQKWRSKTFKGNFTNTSIAANGDHIFVGNEGKLAALNRSDGQVAWEASLAADLQTGVGCKANPCLRVFGDKVVSLAKDGTLQAFNAASGQQAWSKRLNYTSDEIFDALGNPAVVDTTDGKNTEATFYIFDANTGEVMREIAPSCRIGNREERPFAVETWQLAPDGKSLYVIDDGSTACAYRYDLTTGDQMWAYVPQEYGESVLPFTSNGPTVIGPEAAFVANAATDNQIIAIDGTTGEPRVLIQDARTVFTLVDANADVVIAQASPTYDRQKTQLWGIDAKTGDKLWQYALTGEAFTEKAVLKLSENGLFVATATRDDKQLLIDVLNPRTGVSKGQVTETADTAILTSGAFTKDRAWLNVWSNLWEVDLATGKVLSKWP
jgi:outer membrane protein assembly factor BamB